MFVKWSVRAKRRSPALGDSLVARLVESRRPGPGLAPRQVQVAYLGAIRTSMHTNHRIVFWENAMARLDELQLEPDKRAAVVAALEARVPAAHASEWRD
jgi:hypothetical protein